MALGRGQALQASYVEFESPYLHEGGRFQVDVLPSVDVEAHPAAFTYIPIAHQDRAPIYGIGGSKFDSC